MTDDIVVVGAGGFGREVVDVMEAVNAAESTPRWNLRGVVDDSPSEENLQRLQVRGIPYLGDLQTIISDAARPHFVIGIGSPGVRRALAERLDAAGFSAATLIHPSASTGSAVTIDPGSVICAGVRLTTNIAIGRHAHLNLNSTVGHDSTLGDYVSVNPLASISGDCVLDDEVLIGVAASIINGVTVGSGSVVGGGACAVRDVPSDTTVVGVPATPLTKKRSS